VASGIYFSDAQQQTALARRAFENERMTAYQWLGIPAAVLLIGFIVFAFRQGLRVKPDRNNKDNWPQYGGPSDGLGT
jgi:hypothetical protein